MIGDDIQIEILEMSKTQVLIGVKAPKSIEVHRLEIYKKIQAEKSGGKMNRGDK